MGGGGVGAQVRIALRGLWRQAAAGERRARSGTRFSVSSTRAGVSNTRGGVPDTARSSRKMPFLSRYTLQCVHRLCWCVQYSF